MPIPRQEIFNYLAHLPLVCSRLSADIVVFIDRVKQLFSHKLMISGADLRVLTDDLYRINQDNSLILASLSLWLGNFQKNLTAEDRADLQLLLYRAIFHKANDLVDTLLDVGFGLEVKGPVGGEEYNALLFSILHDNMTVFELLLPVYVKAGRLNDSNQDGETALYLAVRFKREAMLNKLIKEKDLEFIGRCRSSILFDVVRLNPQEWDKLITAMNKKSLYFDWDRPLDVPIALLKKETQQWLFTRLKEELKQNKFFAHFPSIQDRILVFINNGSPLAFKRMNRFSIAFEVVSYLLHPEWINQHTTNLCGPAVVMQQLIMNDPEKFVNMVFELAELTSSSTSPQFLPTHVKAISKNVMDTCWVLDSFWLETMRHNYNARLGFSSNSQFADYTALTTPHLIAKMFDDMGLTVVRENMQIRFSKNNKISAFFENVRPWVAKVGFLIEPYKLYGKHDEQPDAEQRFNGFLKMVDGSKAIPILINKKLLFLILKQKDQPDKQKIIEFSHYVNVYDFKYDATAATVSFKCMTFGNIYVVKDLDKKIFAENFLGGIQIKPNLPRKLSPTI